MPISDAYTPKQNNMAETLEQVIKERDALRICFAEASHSDCANGRERYLKDGWLFPEKVEELVKAVWNAAFRIGYNNGSSNATSWEWGCGGTEPKEAEKAWKEDVQWMIDTEFDPIDIKDPKHWERV
jgi:hypothetical protein